MKTDLISEHNLTDDKIREIAEIIKQGGIVIFPTETVYGIGANALNTDAVKKLYKIKQRPLTKPISLLVSNMDMINQVAENITDMEYKLMNNFFPGPLTIILKKKDIISNIVTANQETVGIRMPSNELARKLIEYAGVPIATPSANISGKPSGIDIKEIEKDFYGKVNCIIKGNDIKFGISSTIVKVNENIPYILRYGSITKEQIEDVLFKS